MLRQSIGLKYVKGVFLFLFPGFWITYGGSGNEIDDQQKNISGFIRTREHIRSCVFCTLSLFTYFVNQARPGKLYCLNRAGRVICNFRGKTTDNKKCEINERKLETEIGQKTLQGHMKMTVL